MTRKDKGHYAKKHPSDSKIDQKLAEAVQNRTVEGEIPCAAAFKIVNELKVSPLEVGFTIDILEIPVTKCQLGLFGYEPRRRFVQPAESVSPGLEDTIRKALVNDRLTCTAAWEIAERLGIGKMDVTAACEALKIKIAFCQLGTF
ncbi:MAG: hypothetical protein PVH82_02405 [Desulfobacteraceae bacterium]|jgi:hypothetical protein